METVRKDILDTFHTMRVSVVAGISSPWGDDCYTVELSNSSGMRLHIRYLKDMVETWVQQAAIRLANGDYNVRAPKEPLTDTNFKEQFINAYMFTNSVNFADFASKEEKKSKPKDSAKGSAEGMFGDSKSKYKSYQEKQREFDDFFSNAFFGAGNAGDFFSRFAGYGGHARTGSSYGSGPDIKTPNVHAILGVKATATKKEIRTAYLNKLKEWHPDRNQHRAKEANEKCQQFNDAYDILKKAGKA